MSGIVNLNFVGLDSNLFIYNLEENPQFISYTDLVFQKLAEGRLKAVTSVISLTEILSYPKTAIMAEKIIEDFFNTPKLEVIEVDKYIAIEAASIRREYKFHLPDSIQIATAKYAKAKAYITNDKRLKSFKGLEIILLTDL